MNRIKEIENLLDQDAYEQALALTEQALAADPDDRSLYVLRGRARMGLYADPESLSPEETERRFAAIRSDFANGFTGSPRDVIMSYKGMMMLNLAAGREEECIALCEKYREEFHSNDCNYFWASALAAQYDKDEDPEKLKRAEKLLREAGVSGRPGRIIRMALARILLMQRRPDEALAIGKQLLNDRKLFPDSYMIMVQSYMALEQPQKALPYIRDIVEAAPDDPVMRSIRAEVALEAGKFGMAGADAEFCLALGPDPRMTLIAVRAACQTAGEPEEFRSQLERLRAARPEGPDYDFLETEVDILCDLGEKEEALALLQRAEAEAGEEQDRDLCRDRISRVLASMGRYDEALAITEELSARYSSVSFDYYRGMILFDRSASREDLENAREALLKAIRGGFDGPPAVIRLIRTARILGDYPFLNNLLHKGRLPKWAQNYLAGILCEEVKHDHAGAVLLYSRALRQGMDCVDDLLRAQMHVYNLRGTAPLWAAVAELSERSDFWKRSYVEALAYGLLGLTPDKENRDDAFHMCLEIVKKDQDYSCAISLSGQLVLQGWGTERDPVLAFQLFELARETDQKTYPFCHCQDGFLAACLEKGEGTAKDPARAKALILEAVGQSGVRVHDNVAAMYVFYFLRGEEGFTAETVRALYEQDLADNNFNPVLWTSFLRAASKAGLDEKRIRRRLKQCEAMGAQVLNEYAAAHAADPEFFPFMCS